MANRLQAALWREAFYLAEQGVVSVADLDTAIAQGPSLRWALLGPFLNLHLSGGAGGITQALAHLGPPIEDWWADLGQVELGPELIRTLASGVDDELQGADQHELIKKRDALLMALIREKEKQFFSVKIVPISLKEE